MTWTDEHLGWLKLGKTKLSTADGKAIKVVQFEYQNDAKILSAWAKHFRNHYCSDAQIDQLRKGTGLSRSEYLKRIKFPSEKDGFGPSIRAGDFAEILIADFLQYKLDFWVPRTRYLHRTIRDESTKGTDVLGFKMLKGKPNVKDELALYEVKAQLSGKAAKPKLQEAIDDSIKDEVRKAESLNALKQRALDVGALEDVATIERFQNMADQPYTEKCGAVALFSTDVYSEDEIKKSTANHHPKASGLFIAVFTGKDLMNLVHQLYKRAADEA